MMQNLEFAVVVNQNSITLHKKKYIQMEIFFLLQPSLYMICKTLLVGSSFYPSPKHVFTLALICFYDHVVLFFVCLFFVSVLVFNRITWKLIRVVSWCSYLFRSFSNRFWFFFFSLIKMLFPNGLMWKCWI